MEKLGEELSIKLNLSENHIRKAQNFFLKYDLISILGDSDTKYILGNRTDKICRFCKKSDNVVKFKKAHVIPEFMGNHNLLSYFECASCNELFSKYENSFANFLGVSKTISQIKGKKNKVPKHKEKKTGLEMSITDSGMQITAIEGTDVFDFDEKNKLVTLKTKKPGYIPIHIPKILIKMGFCMLPEEELEEYEYTRKFLIDTENSSKFKDFNLLRIYEYFIPGPPRFEKPFIQLFKKKYDSSNIPKYQLIFYYGNYQFQFVLPFGKGDKYLSGKNIDFPIAPLLTDSSYMEEFGQETFSIHNLTSDEKKSNESLNITFSVESFKDTDLSK